eukprot:gene4873-3494_t
MVHQPPAPTKDVMKPPLSAPNLQQTFHDGGAGGSQQHRWGHQDGPGSHYAWEEGAGGAPAGRRWSFLLQDAPRMLSRALNSIHYGYAARLGLLLGVGSAAGYAFYKGVLVKSQEHKPLAQRWWLFSPPVPITLIDRQQVEGSNMYYYRFALPHHYDYAGYDPISSVQICSGRVRGLSSVTRWYTPISHPQERGIIEFAIKDCDPGRMSARLRGLAVGEQVHLGRWMREFRYQPHAQREIGVICTTGGASVALQLLNYLDKQPADRTCVSLLYCHSSPVGIPFRREFQDFASRDNRFTVFFNAFGLGMEAYRNPALLVSEGLELGKNLFTGGIQPETVRRTMPPPVRATGDAAAAYRPPLLICGPQSLLTFVCGKVSTFAHTTYYQGPFYKFYTGFLYDMGYDRRQVYKFGVSKHFMAIQ